jgi:hypothetical protein
MHLDQNCISERIESQIDSLNLFVGLFCSEFFLFGSFHSCATHRRRQEFDSAPRAWSVARQQGRGQPHMPGTASALVWFDAGAASAARHRAIAARKGRHIATDGVGRLASPLAGRSRPRTTGAAAECQRMLAGFFQASTEGEKYWRTTWYILPYFYVVHGAWGSEVVRMTLNSFSFGWPCLMNVPCIPLSYKKCTT